MQTVAIVNQKGGVGKTTTVCNLGAALAEGGRRVLLVDLDAQAHLTFHLGVDNNEVEATTYDLMTGRRSIGEVVITRSERLDLMPSHIDLAGAEVELVSTLARERILRDNVATCADGYDYALIDCPPSLGLMTLNALVAADEIIITLQPHVLALQGMSNLLETAQLVRRRLNPRLHVTGLVFCMFDGRTTLASEVLADVESYFARAAKGSRMLEGACVFNTRVRRNIKLAEAPGFGQTIFEYAPSSHGAEDYHHLAREVLAMPTGVPADSGKGAATASAEPESTQRAEPATEATHAAGAESPTPGPIADGGSDLAAAAASEPSDRGTSPRSEEEPPHDPSAA